MLLTTEQRTKYTAYLDQHKKLVGLSEYRIVLLKKAMISPDVFARVYPDRMEKILEIELNEEFFKLSKDRQENILVHELCHARLLIFKQTGAATLEELEEELVNDLTRGLCNPR